MSDKHAGRLGYIAAPLHPPQIGIPAMSQNNPSMPLGGLAAAIRAELQKEAWPGLSLWTLQDRLNEQGHGETASRIVEALSRLIQAGQVSTSHAEDVTLYRLRGPATALATPSNDNKVQVAVEPAAAAVRRLPVALMRRLVRPVMSQPEQQEAMRQRPARLRRALEMGAAAAVTLILALIAGVRF